MDRAEDHRLHKEADELVRAMYEGRVGWSARERARELKVQAAFATLRRDATESEALCRLIYGGVGASGLATVEPVVAALGPQAGNTGLDVLLQLARRRREWIREPEEWAAPSAADVRTRANSLVSHLFARYPLPPFLDAAWAMGFSDSAEAFRGWVTHLGRGGKLETISFPMPMTHRAAHFFLLAPPHYSIPAALRYGQIRALGGSESLADVVAETFLNGLQANEPFWHSAIHFLVNHSQIRPSQVGPLLDFLRFRKFGTGGGDDPPEPNLSMKGRTPDALLRRLDEWHATLARLGQGSRKQWPSCGIAPLDRTEKDPLSAATARWRVVEVAETLALAEEGREMRHCVRSYQDACLKGNSAIFSLRLTLSDSPAVVRRLLTIEVNLHRRAVVQVRGKCNQTLSAMRGNRRMMLARDVLRSWARSQHLGIACSL